MTHMTRSARTSILMIILTASTSWAARLKELLPIVKAAIDKNK